MELYKADNKGNLNLLNRYDWLVLVERPYVSEIETLREVTTRYVSILSQPLCDLAWHLFGKRIWPVGHPPDSEVVGELMGIIEWLLPRNNTLNWLLSASMLIFALWHGWPRRTSGIKLVLWLVFVWVFNLAGLLTYLALNHTLVIKCPACGRRRCLAQVNCVRCGSVLPEPEPGKLALIINS